MPTPEPDPTVVDPSVLAERRARRAEAPERALAAERRLADVQAQLDATQEEQSRLSAELAVAERELQLARDREQAEQRARVDAESELAAHRRSSGRELLRLRGALADAEQRAVDLLEEIDQLTQDLEAAEERATVASRSAATQEEQEELARLRDELGRRAEAEERLTAELAAERLRVADAVERISAALRDLPGGEAGGVVAARLSAEVPTGEHPALAAVPAAAGPADGLIDDISRARERLRAAAPAVGATADGLQEEPAAEEPAAEEPTVEEPAAEEPTVEEPAAEEAEVEEPAAEAVAAQETVDPEETPSWLLTPPPTGAGDRSAAARAALLTLKVTAAALPVGALIVLAELTAH